MRTTHILEFTITDKTKYSSIIAWRNCDVTTVNPIYRLMTAYVQMTNSVAIGQTVYAAVATTIRFRFNGRSTAIRLLIKGH